jgi:hypothetical protein
MKKLVCLLAVIALAASASAAIDVITNGVFQGPWTAGDWTEGTAPDSTPAATGVFSSWASTGATGTVKLAGNEYLEFDAYFSSAQAGRRMEAMHIEVNNDGGWTYKWQQNCDTWVDGTYYPNLSDYVAPADTWVHVKIDLKDNCAGPTGGLPPVMLHLDFYNDNIGLIRLHPHYPNATDVSISNMQFTPEPATIALLGLGGLALIRRKR